MSSVESLRDFISQRLTAAAAEIFTEFEKTIEEEIARQRGLLCISWTPQINTDTTEVPQQSVWKEDEVLADLHLCYEERSFSQDQNPPEPPQIKEEQGELFSSNEEERLVSDQDTETSVLLQNTSRCEEKLEVIPQDFNQNKEEISVCHSLLGINFNPEVRLHRIDLQQQHVCKEQKVLSDQKLWNQRNSSLDQEEPELPQMKEEQEELCSSQEGEQLVLKQETDTFMLTPTDQERDLNEAEPNTEQLYSHDSPLTETTNQEQNQDLDSGSTGDVEMNPKKKHHGNRTEDESVEHSHASQSQSDAESGEKAFKCDVCGNVFRKESEMLHHYRIHTEKMTEKGRRTKTPDQDALEYIIRGEDKAFLEGKFINEVKGKGVFTSEHIKPKSFVLEYRGVFSLSEDADDKNQTNMFDFMWNGKRYCVDASKEDGTLGQLVNDDHVHPNCKLKRIMVKGRPHFCLFAVKDIFPGEEITYNYGNFSWPWRSTASCEAQCDPKGNESDPDPEKVSCETQCDPKVNESDPEKDVSGGTDDQMSGVSSNPAISKDGTDVEQNEDVSISFPPCSDDESTYITSRSNTQTLSAEIAKPSSPETSAAQEGSFCTLKNYCFVCKLPQTKIARHLKKHEHEDPDIAKAFSFPKYSKERKRFLEKLRNKGNYEHNQEVLKKQDGTLKIKRRPVSSKSSVDTKMYVHCAYCKGLYLRKELWRHSGRCPSKTVSETEDSVNSKVLVRSDIAESTSCQAISPGIWKILGNMRPGKVASVVRGDFLILQLAQYLYDKHGSDPTKFEYIRTKVREMGRLLLTLSEKYSIFNFEDAIKSNNFSDIIGAVKTVAGYDEEKHSYSTPSLAMKLGHSLKKIGDIILCRAISAKDEDLIKAAEQFTKFCTKEWTGHSAPPGAAAKLDKSSTITFTEDVQLLHKYLEGKSASAFENLKEHQSPQTYAELARVTLTQMILFNRRRAGEVSKMTLESFKKRDQTELHSDVAASLSPFEQTLARHFSRVEIRGKRRKVAVLLNPEVVSAATLLADKRETCNVHKDNPFLFGRPQCPPTSYYKGQDCIRLFAQKCGAKNPENLWSSHLRKHIAALSQILNLKSNELDQLANLLGRDVQVHRDFAHLPEATMELAEITKLLLAMEKETDGEFQGKTLDEIEVEDEGEEDDGDNEGDEDGHDSKGDGENEENQEMKTPEEPTSSSVKRKRMASTQNETSCYKEMKSRRCVKRPWSKNEISAVMKHFRKHILHGVRATTMECRQCKLAEHTVLKDRSPQNIRDFVRNRGRMSKRKLL